MRTPLSSWIGGPFRVLLLEPTFGGGETGAFEPGPLLVPESTAKFTSPPSRTSRTSLSLDALGGGDLELLVFRIPERVGSLPSPTSSLSSAPRLKLKTSLPESPALPLAASPNGSSGSLP